MLVRHHATSAARQLPGSSVPAAFRRVTVGTHCGSSTDLIV